MILPDHYTTLQVKPSATQTEIKQSYRRLAKRFHPDSNREAADHAVIVRLNAAYEVLGDPQQRQAYDRERQMQAQLAAAGFSTSSSATWEQRAEAAQAQVRQRQASSQAVDQQLKQWINQIYNPVNRQLQQILSPLRYQINELAADPFDDELMQDFQDYLEDCRHRLHRAERLFRSQPNPSNVAGVAAHLYYCLNQVSDGLEQLEFFTANYDDHYLHTGQELFRIAAKLRKEAQAAIRNQL
jgi:molecular chaperone DnaJ